MVEKTSFFWKVAVPYCPQRSYRSFAIAHDHKSTVSVNMSASKSIFTNRRLRDLTCYIGLWGCACIRSSLMRIPRMSLTILGIGLRLHYPAQAWACRTLSAYFKRSIEHVKTERLHTHPSPRTHIISGTSIITPPSIYIKPPLILSLQSSSSAHSTPRLLHAVSSPHPLQLQQ